MSETRPPGPPDSEPPSQSEGAAADATEFDAADEALARSFDPASLRVFLVVTHGGDTDVVDVPDGARLVVGRGDDVDVPIEDSRASRRHAMLTRRGAELGVADLESRNGTRVNGRLLRAGQTALAGGDVVRIGRAELVVAIASGSVVEKPAAGAELPPVAELAEGIVVADPAMRKVFEVARRLARASTTALVVGETGAGKEVVAAQIHRWSERARGPFVRINCASIPEPLLESELFGYEKGAFTGADRRKIGLLEAADRGTLLLDEIGELPLGMQAKLLSALENRRIVRVGGTRDLAVDVRILCATHRDLEAEVGAGRFRQDLFYRVSAFTVRVPPLRDRPAEIVLLSELFAQELGRRLGHERIVIAPDAAATLLEHRWPGNVRELRNAIEHAVVLSDDGVVCADQLPESVRRRPEGAGDGALRGEIASVERKKIEQALAATNGVRAHAAKRLGISRRALIYKIAKYGL